MPEESGAQTEQWQEYEEKLDELNAGLLEAYAAGYAKALEDYDVGDSPFTNPDQVRKSEHVQECHFYYWDGRVKPLKQWLREEFGIETVGDDD